MLFSLYICFRWGFVLDVEELIMGLRFSGERVGQLYPVLLDKHGNVVDGLHRLKADPNWPKIRLVARLIANVCRRNVPAEEKSRMLEELGELYVKEGVSLELNWPERFPR